MSQCAKNAEVEHPLPLGEGWGEGLVMKTEPKISLLVERAQEAKRVFFMATQATPSPNPLPMGEGFTYKG